MDSNVEKDCTLLEDLFQQIINDMKNSFPVWDDFMLKSGRLNSALKTVGVCMGSFLEAFQKVADMATGTRGSTREIGSALTRLCLRHRSIESKIKGLNSAITDAMIIPLQERMEDWKRTVASLDRDHAKESKRVHQDLKRASLEAVRQQKKLKKGKMETSEQLDRAVQDVNDKLLLLREFEKSSVKTSLIEERSRLCLFISCLKPVMDEEMAMLTEVTHLQEIVHSLCMVADDPESLSNSSEQVISDLIGARGQHPPLPAAAPGSPSSEGSLTSSAGSLSHSPTHHATYSRSQSQPNPVTGSLSLTVKDGTMSLCGQDGSHLAPFSTSSAGETQSTGSSSSVQKIGDCPKSAPVVPSAGNAGGYETGNRQQRNSKLLRNKDYSYPVHYERPHTISTAYERSASRPIITSETYLAPEIGHRPQLQSQQQHRPQSTYVGNSGNDNPYAVPCVVPKRRPTQSGDTKVADIYARPSLVSGTGYRTPNIRPVPVATPTVPDFGAGQQPAFPVAGYVNMNQLAHMAMQHQQEMSQKKELTESSDEKTDDDESAQKCPVGSSVDRRRLLRGSRPYASESDQDPEIEPHQSYGTWSSSSHTRESSVGLPETGLPGSGIGMSAMYSGKAAHKEASSSSMPRGFSLSDVPQANRTSPQSYHLGLGDRSRAMQYARPSETWSPDPESPVFK